MGALKFMLKTYPVLETLIHWDLIRAKLAHFLKNNLENDCILLKFGSISDQIRAMTQNWNI